MKIRITIPVAVLLIAASFGSADEFAREAAVKQAHINKQLAIHPWRVVDGVTYHTSGPGWYTFHGKVVGVHPDGIRVYGFYDEKLAKDLTLQSERDFFVRNFPYEVVEDDKLSYLSAYQAKLVGAYTYRTVLGASRTIRCFDYGIPCAPPTVKTPKEDPIVVSNRLAKARSIAADATLKFHQTQAAAGDRYGLREMGHRHLTGHGVDRDLVKARQLLSEASGKGDEEAATLLRELLRTNSNQVTVSTQR
jgi:hypothetical protein